MLHLDAGRAHDVTTVPSLLEGLKARGIIADRAYHTKAVRSLTTEQGAKAVIRSTQHRTIAIAHDVVVYKLRNRIERFINKAKHFRNITTRYGRCAV